MPPESVSEQAPAHRRLQVEADQWYRLSDATAMRDQFRLTGIAQGAETEHSCIVPKGRSRPRFPKGLSTAADKRIDLVGRRTETADHRRGKDIRVCPVEIDVEADNVVRILLDNNTLHLIRCIQR